MTTSSTAPDFRPVTGYNDPPDNIFGNSKGKERATDSDGIDDEEMDGSHVRGSDQTNLKGKGRKSPKQPRSRRMNNSSVSSTNHLRSDSRASSNAEKPEASDHEVEATAGRRNRYPAHSSIPTQSNGGPPASLGHLSESFDRELHALEHEFQDTLFRGSEADRRIRGLAREESRDSQSKYHLEDQSMEMDVTIDEKTLRSLRRSRYLRSAAVTGIFVLLWYVFCHRKHNPALRPNSRTIGISSLPFYPYTTSGCSHQNTMDFNIRFS